MFYIMWSKPVVVALVALGCSPLMSCGSNSDETAQDPGAVATVTATATQTVSVESNPASSAASSQVGGKNDDSADDKNAFVMPNEVGKVLQAAQDDLQAISGNAFFYSGSEDATGEGRGQFLDSGWQVCSQNVKPGESVRDDNQDIVFAVVRISETCP